MKQIATLIALVCSLTIYSQTLSLGIGQDIRMAMEGPYYNKVNDIGPTFDLEFRLASDWESWRLWTAYEIHQEIGYSKWTYFAVDYRIANPYIPFTDIQLRNFIFYAGGELGEIRRYHPGSSYEQVNNYTRVEVTNFLPGINGEIKYQIKNSPIAFSISGGIFQSEFELRQYKEYRTDVFFNMYIDMFKVNK